MIRNGYEDPDLDRRARAEELQSCGLLLSTQPDTQDLQQGLQTSQETATAANAVAA